MLEDKELDLDTLLKMQETDAAVITETKKKL